MEFLRMLEGMRTPLLDKIMQLVTYFGQELFIIAIICLLFWCMDKRFAYQLGFVYFTAGLCVQTLKITFRIPRPWVLDPNFHAVESAIPGATGYSFPSGHTQGATSFFAPLALKVRTSWAKLLCVLAFLLIGFSRMYLGCHTPKDVITAMIVSLICTYIIWHFQEKILGANAHKGIIALILAAVSLSTAIYSIVLLNKGVIEMKYAIDCCKAAGAGLGFAWGWYLETTRLDFDPTKGSTGFQILKYVLGLVLAIVIKSAFSFIFGKSILAKMAEYFILVLWIIYFYPCLFSKFKKR